MIVLWFPFPSVAFSVVSFPDQEIQILFITSRSNLFLTCLHEEVDEVVAPLITIVTYHAVFE